VIVGRISIRQSPERRVFAVKRPLFILAVVLCALGPVAPAKAGGLLSGVLPGLVSPSDTPSVCDAQVVQPFTRFADDNNYVLVPGGAFELGDPAWTLAHGAKVVRGNESFYVNERTDQQSLSLPNGSTATSPAMCFDPGDWHFRFFVAGSGSVRVKVVVKSLLGVLSTVDGGTVKAGSTWKPSPEVELLLTNVCGLVSTDSVSLRLTPTSGSNVRVDDVYLDPWKVG
jgi:hypothetical protein